MSYSKLSVIIPAYNESDTITIVLQKVFSVVLVSDLQLEVIVIDDCSVDDTGEQVTKFKQSNPQLSVFYHKQERNRGKGAAIHTGIKIASGELMIIQDADLEYDPNDYNKLLLPVIEGHADIVFGSRFIGGKPHRILFFWHTIGNKLLTFISNMFNNLNLSDMETGYKLFRTEIIRSVRLKEERFGFEPEIVAKVAKIPHIRLYEVGISYYGRTYREGKKIGWKDGFRALYCIVRYGL